MTAVTAPSGERTPTNVLERIQRRVLWLATLMIHHANHLRPNPDDMKVGGHQASSASMVSILTVLYFRYLESGDRVSVKPHASPVYHAIQYLLGNLDRRYLTTLRDFGGLQAYPSRTKDPDQPDFSTGSVGLGAVAPAFAALVHRYASLHVGPVTSRRFIAVVGDAELDEGNVWEAVAEEMLRDLGNVLIVVDLNRQSLDRIVPGIRAHELEELFKAAGWRVLEAKYGRRLKTVFARTGGEALRSRIDDMSNEEYQSLLRRPGAHIRRALAQPDGADGPVIEDIASAIAETPDAELPSLLGNLGGHDVEELTHVFTQADEDTSRPTILFAYTIKGWGLPFAGDPLNHSMLLGPRHVAALQRELGITEGTEWDAFDPDSPEGRWCRDTAVRLRHGQEARTPVVAVSAIPEILGVSFPAKVSTQEALGRVLPRLADLPEVGQRIVTTAPDVAVSTHLSNWINKVGVYAPEPHPDFQGDAPRAVRWIPGTQGRHIELGISEMNLFMLLGQLGLSEELCGQILFPIGTVYDPFVCRGLDALIYALYGGAKMIFAGTPSGVSLSREGGAHQSTVTPSLGIELPGLTCYEPTFAAEVEWILLDALRQCTDRRFGHSTYLRLTTKKVDQRLLDPALARIGEPELRRQALAGGYRLLEGRDLVPDARATDTVQLVATGAMLPEAVEAAHILAGEGVAANVIAVTSGDLLFTELRAERARRRRNSSPQHASQLETLLPPGERRTPIVTVHDASAHSLAFLGGVFGAPVVPLGVDHFGQSGSLGDLYRDAEISVHDIVAAAYAALDLG
jgi:pyruvate dehydrogenase E1 component